MFPVRCWAPVLGETVEESVPLPVPLADEAFGIQLARLAAFQVQPAEFEVRLTERYEWSIAYERAVNVRTC